MVVIPLFFVAAALLLTFLPAVLLPLSNGVVSPRREDFTLSAGLVLTVLAAAVTVLNPYLVTLIPPLVAFCLSAIVAGMVGRRPLSFGMGAVAVYVAIIGSWLGGILASTTGIALLVLLPLASGAMGGLAVAGIWRLRRWRREYP